MPPASDMAHFLGRFHVLLVHLPIGLIVLVAFLELLARSPRFKHVNSAVGAVLALAVPATIASVICGWLLARGDEYEPNLLRLHKWMGIALAAACTLTTMSYGLRLRNLYRLGLVVTFVLLVGAGHLGGSLTHGKDYLTRYAPSSLRTWMDPGEKTPALQPAPSSPNPLEGQVFSDIIEPTFKQYCVGCHGPEKSGAKLRLDSYPGILKGSENGPILVSGKPGESELIKRLRLPLATDDHMPPQGKPQPGDAELALLEWWIAVGAPLEKRVGELQPPAPIQRLLETRRRPGVSVTTAPASAVPDPASAPTQ
jgi:hypothetical protein